MSVTDETLLLFVDGLLPEAEAEAIAAALESDPDLAERAALLTDGRDAARRAFADALAEPVPARLIAAATAPPAENDNRPAWRRGGIGMLAGLAAGFALAFALPRGEGDGMLTPRILAALESRGGTVGGGVTVVATHVTEAGTVCRAFSVEERAGGVAGLACREEEGWRLRAAVARTGGGGYQPASGVDPVIGEVLERLGAGPALSAEEEAVARRRGWAPRH
jgi:anti-sigma factor RsiW